MRVRIVVCGVALAAGGGEADPEPASSLASSPPETTALDACDPAWGEVAPPPPVSSFRPCSPGFCDYGEACVEGVCRRDCEEALGCAATEVCVTSQWTDYDFYGSDQYCHCPGEPCPVADEGTGRPPSAGVGAWTLEQPPGATALAFGAGVLWLAAPDGLYRSTLDQPAVAERVADLPEPMDAAALAFGGGRLYLASRAIDGMADGGHVWSAAATAAEVGAWEAEPDQPFPRARFSFLWADGWVLVAGGGTTGTLADATDIGWIARADATGRLGDWRLLPLPIPTSPLPAAALSGDRLWVVGADGDGATVASLPVAALPDGDWELWRTGADGFVSGALAAWCDLLLTVNDAGDAAAAPPDASGALGPGAVAPQVWGLGLVRDVVTVPGGVFALGDGGLRYAPRAPVAP